MIPLWLSLTDWSWISNYRTPSISLNTKQGVVVKIEENSTQLAEALKAGSPIIITTLQKFPFVTEKVGALPKKKYAVIIDEAHTSQGGEGAAEMKGVLGAKKVNEERRGPGSRA